MLDKNITHNVIMFGIKNCDTIKKAKKWLEVNNIDFHFHDYRQDGTTSEWLTKATEMLDWEIVLNKRGTTYRQLDDEIKNSLTKSSAIEEMVKQPAMIKRPILQVGDALYIGFKDADYQNIFQA